MHQKTPILSWSLSRWWVCGIVSLVVLAGCAAAYTPPPVPTSHPAHPEAPMAPEPPPSHTLAYGSADVPSPQPPSAMAQSGMPQSMHHGAPAAMQDSHASTSPDEQFVGEGKVIAVVPGSAQLVVDHQAIPGFMDAMTMGYRVDPPSLLEGVQAGDLIRFTLDAQHKAIVKIEKRDK